MATSIASVRLIFRTQLPLLMSLKIGRQCSNIIARSLHHRTSSLHLWTPVLATNRVLPDSLHCRCCSQLSHLKDVKGCYCSLQRMLPGISVARYSSSDANLSNEEEEEDQLYKWIELKVKGHDNAVLDSYQTFVSSAAKELDIKFEILEHPGRDIYRLTLLKSRHIYKKHRVQYEMRTNYRLMKLRHLTGNTAGVFLEYIERNLSEGLAMQVKKCSIEQMPEHLTKPPEGLEESLPEEQEEMRADLSSSSSSSSDEVEEVDETSSSPPEKTEKTEDSSSDSDSDSSSDSDSDSDEEDEKR
ncbi:uncharacterized protein [Apostichopus japonicus]|uniref:uncharacterized protein n=1 Tax=Stichopus japonicus TaxID=307972 RepID=UPI003AB806BB